MCAQTSKPTLQRKIQERQADVAAKKQQLTEVLADNEQLKERVANQTLCKNDIYRMLAERHKQKEILDSVLRAREQLDKRAYEQEVQVSETEVTSTLLSDCLCVYSAHAETGSSGKMFRGS